MEKFSFSLFEIEEKKKRKCERIFSSNGSFYFSFIQGFFKNRKNDFFPQKVRIFLGHEKIPFLFFFIKDTKVTISSCFEGSIKIWENLSQRVLRTIKFKNSFLEKIICHQKINILVIVCSRKIILFDYNSGDIIMKIPFYYRIGGILNIIAPGNIFVIENLDKTLNFFDIDKKTFFRKIKFSKLFSTAWVTSFSPFSLFLIWGKNFFEFNFDENLESVFFLEGPFFLEQKNFFRFLFHKRLEILSEIFFFSFIDSYLTKKTFDRKTRLVIG